MQLHPLNQGFTWTVRQAAPRLVTPQQLRDYDERGFFVLERALDKATVERAIEEIDPFEARTTEFLRTQPDSTLFIAKAEAITFTINLVLLSPWLRDLCARQLFADLGHDLIGPDVRLYWEQAVYKKPEPQRDFPWHQDNGYTYIEPQCYLTCWIALTDADEENGCPWVVPGVHRMGTLAHTLTPLGWQCLEQPQEAVPLPVRAGDIAVFSSLTPHRTGANRSDRIRKSYIVQYAPDAAHRIDRADGEGRVKTPQQDPDRQFFVLRGGERPLPGAQ